jgi:hypothetical protein
VIEPLPINSIKEGELKENSLKNYIVEELDSDDQGG